MGSIVTAALGLFTSLSNLCGSITGWLTQRTIFNAGKSEGKQEATAHQAAAEQEVVQMEQSMREAPKVSTTTTVDNDAVDAKLREGKF